MSTRIRPTKKHVDSDTLDISWITEEEELYNLNDLPQKKCMEKIRIQFWFVNSESIITHRIFRDHILDIDHTNNISILSKTALLLHIENAKSEYKEWMDGITADIRKIPITFSLMDILIWNVNVDTEHIPQYADTCAPEWIGRDFVRGSMFHDIILDPSLFLFHSNQTVYVFLREIPKQIPFAISGDGLGNIPISKKKHTKRVHFSGEVPIESISNKLYSRRFTRKVFQDLRSLS